MYDNSFYTVHILKTHPSVAIDDQEKHPGTDRSRYFVFYARTGVLSTT